jgi:hypothetical protein
MACIYNKVSITLKSSRIISDVRGVDDAYEDKTHTWNNDDRANVVQATDGFFPGHTLGVLGWEVEQGQADQRYNLCDEAPVENVRPRVA